MKCFEQFYSKRRLILSVRIYLIIHVQVIVEIIIVGNHPWVTGVTRGDKG